MNFIKDLFCKLQHVDCPLRRGTCQFRFGRLTLFIANILFNTRIQSLQIFIGISAKLRKATNDFDTSVRLSVPSLGTTLSPLKKFFMKFDVSLIFFFENFSNNFKFH
jgi:hypothetical protein